MILQPACIYRLLREKGALDTGYVISDSELDGKRLPLREAIDGVIERLIGHFISCLPGTLASFQP